MLKHDCPRSWSEPHWRILCYHGIPGNFTRNFRAQLAAFRDMGFSFVDLDSGLNLCRGEGFTKPTMTVTFDDGDLTVYKNALPILQELCIKGFLYLTADYVNRGRTYRDKHPLPAMTWDHLRDWIRMGHGLGSHTLTHAPLRLCSDSRLIQECALSKQVIEKSVQVPIRHLSYPFGQHSMRTHELVMGGGLYDSAATIDRGRMQVGHDPYKLRRDVCDPRRPFESIFRLMQLADRWYWLRHFRRKPVSYWEMCPEETWETLLQTELDVSWPCIAR